MVKEKEDANKAARREQQKQQENNDKAIQPSQKGKRKALRPLPQQKKRQKRVGGSVASGVAVRYEVDFGWKATELEIITLRRPPSPFWDQNRVASVSSLTRLHQRRHNTHVEPEHLMILIRTLLSDTCTPTMAWNYHFRDMEAFYAKRFAQVNTQNALNKREDAPTPQPKRAAAVAALEAQKSLRPRKRRRCE